MSHVLVIEEGLILAADDGRVRSGAEGIANPFDAVAPVRAAIDADDVESGCAAGEPGTAGKEHLCRSYEFALFAGVNGRGRPGESAGRTKTNLHENQAALVKHDEVDFAEPAAIISLDRLQSPGPKVLKRKFLGNVTYSSGVSSYHAWSPSDSSLTGSPSSSMVMSGVSRK